MLDLFIPNAYVQSVFEITPSYLKEHGIKTIITDLDNTLIAWDEPYATRELVTWFEQMQKAGIEIIIVSNNKELRVQQFADPHQIPYIFKARKPLNRAYKTAMRKMNSTKVEVVMLGDQLLTDIFGGNRLGIHTILVKPVVTSDGLPTRVNRFFERHILNILKKQGKLTWEDKK